MDINVLEWKLLSADYWQNTIQTDLGFKSITWQLYHKLYLEYVAKLSAMILFSFWRQRIVFLIDLYDKILCNLIR